MGSALSRADVRWHLGRSGRRRVHRGCIRLCHTQGPDPSPARAEQQQVEPIDGQARTPKAATNVVALTRTHTNCNSASGELKAGRPSTAADDGRGGGIRTHILVLPKHVRHRCATPRQSRAHEGMCFVRSGEATSLQRSAGAIAPSAARILWAVQFAAIHDSSTRRCRASSLTRARLNGAGHWPRRRSSPACASGTPRRRSPTSRPLAQWTSTVPPSASCPAIQATASVSTSGTGTVTSGTRYWRNAMPCASKNDGVGGPARPARRRRP